LAVLQRRPVAILTKTQIDRLGDRLRRGPFSEDDLRLLDQYRRSFGTAYETVITTVRDRLQLEPTGRPAKSTSSIIEKLRRESIRLSQVQDIAGCRVIVTDILAQDQTIATLRETFPHLRVMDRRTNPSYGYRAVHVIVETGGLSVEVQVRSSLQHVWAELSERLSDVVDSSIKYGGGDKPTRELLTSTSHLVSQLEEMERDSLEMQVTLASLQEQAPADERFRNEIIRVKSEVVRAFDEIVLRKEELIQLFQRMTSGLESKKGLEQ